MESPHLLLVSDVSDSGHVSYYYYFLYMYSHLGFVIAICKPKFYHHFFFFLFHCHHWCFSPTDCNSVCGKDSHRKCHVLYITWWQLILTSSVQFLGANKTFPYLLLFPNCSLNWGVWTPEQLRKSCLGFCVYGSLAQPLTPSQVFVQWLYLLLDPWRLKKKKKVPFHYLVITKFSLQTDVIRTL